jgi:hypothetical protein
MISIQKYLRDRDGSKPADPESKTAALLGISLSLLESINTHVLTGDSVQPFRSEIADLAQTLRPNIETAHAAQFQESAGRILSAYGATIGETAHRAAEEMQYFVGTLSRSFQKFGNVFPGAGGPALQKQLP